MSARFDSTTFQPDDLLIAGEGHPVRTRVLTLAAGQNLRRGAVLGAVLGAVTVAAGSANVGNGTVGPVSVGPGTVPGRYVALAIEPATNAGTFVIYDPDGVVVGRANVGSASTGPLGFTIADGTTDFVAGDRFEFTVPEITAATEVRLAVAAAADASATPRFLLAETTDASAGARQCLVYERAEVNGRALVLGAGITLAAATAALRRVGILVTSTLPA